MKTTAMKTSTGTAIAEIAAKVVTCPRPQNCEHRDDERDDGRADVAFGDTVRELCAGDTESTDEGEIEEQLQHARGAMVLTDVSSGHPA